MSMNHSQNALAIDDFFQSTMMPVRKNNKGDSLSIHESCIMETCPPHKSLSNLCCGLAIRNNIWEVLHPEWEP